MESFRRVDRAWARAEGMLTVLVLLAMVAVAGLSAGVRNLTRFDVQWASELLTDMAWADSFLRNATLWLAFLGASQATHYRKHISIDVLTRIAPLKWRWMMHGASGIVAALIAFALAFSLGAAVNLNLHERPADYEMLGDNGSQHVCDATDAQLERLDDLAVPTVFCGVRAVLNLVGIAAETPGAASQIIVPLLFIVIGLRFLAIGSGAVMAVLRGEEALLRLDAEEQARLAAVHAAVAGDRINAATYPPPSEPLADATHDSTEKPDAERPT